MLDFPASPTTGQIYNGTNGVTYRWDGTIWVATGASAGGDFHATFTGTWPGAVATFLFPTVVTGNSGGWYSTGTGRFTPPAGRYYIYAGVTGSTTAGAATNQVVFRKNGTALVTSLDTVSAANLWGQANVAFTADANGTDYFDIQSGGSAWERAGTNAWFGALPVSGIKGPPGDPTPGTLMQTVSFQTGAVAAGTTVIPLDDTIPQNTEGTEFMTLAITPKSATSKLIIEVTGHFTATVNTDAFAALFQDTTANAIAASWATLSNTSGGRMLVSFRHTMTSGTTSSTTFKVRAGPSSAGTITFNGLASARYFGGVMASSIVIQEVAP